MGEVQRWCRAPLNETCLYDPDNQYIDVWDPPMKIAPAHLFYEGVYTLEDAENKNDIPPLWIDILFRQIYLSYNHSYSYKGVDLYRYGIELSPQMSNTTEYPPNSQFNQFGPSGVLNSSAAYDDISIFLSMVLFYGAPDYMANNSKLGLPELGPFDFPFIDIEPKTGAVFHANASMQICSPIHSLPNVNNKKIKENEPNLFNLTDDMMIPMYLVTFSDAVTSDICDNFKHNLGLGNTLHTLSVALGWIGVVLFAVWVLVTVFVSGAYYQKNKE